MATIESIQNLLTKEECQKILTRSFNYPVLLVSYKIKKFSDSPAGFLGDHLTLIITFSAKEKIDQATYFLKSVPQFNVSQLDYVLESGIFRKEVILYQNLLAELNKIGRFGPKCFLVKDNVIVLEDLKSKGFQMNQRLLFFKNDYCLAMITTLARFHVSTIVYEKKWGIKLDEKFKEEIKEATFSFIKGQPRQKWLVSNTKCVIDLFKLIIRENIDEISQRFQKFTMEELQHCIAPSKQFRNVLTHDDLWCNNILFNDKKECLLVDFQLVRYSPPAFDLLTALYLTLDCSFVENNLGMFANLYYSQLVKELKANHLDSRELPREEFEESLQWYKLPALTEAVMYGTHVYISEELSNHIIQDLAKYNEFSFINRSKFAVQEFRDNVQYRGRLLPLLELLVKTLMNKP